MCNRGVDEIGKNEPPGKRRKRESNISKQVCVTKNEELMPSSTFFQSQMKTRLQQLFAKEEHELENQCQVKCDYECGPTDHSAVINNSDGSVNTSDLACRMKSKLTNLLLNQNEDEGCQHQVTQTNQSSSNEKISAQIRVTMDDNQNEQHERVDRTSLSHIKRFLNKEKPKISKGVLTMKVDKKVISKQLNCNPARKVKQIGFEHNPEIGSSTVVEMVQPVILEQCDPNYDEVIQCKDTCIQTKSGDPMLAVPVNCTGDENHDNPVHYPNLWLANPGVQDFIHEMKNLQWRTCKTCKETTFFSTNSKKTCIHINKCSKFSAQNLMDPGPVPKQLQELSNIEEQLIARVHPVISVHKMKGMQLGYSGNVINFPQCVEEFARILPWRIEDLPSIITIRTGDEAVNHCDFYVRAAKVKQALEWLKLNNPWYGDIIISEDVLRTLPENGNVYNVVKCIDITKPVDDNDLDNSSFDGLIANNLKRNMSAVNEKQVRNVQNDDVIAGIEETAVPSQRAVHQDEHIQSVFNWPTVTGEPISEFKTQGYIPKAFPTLFPHGYPDLRGEECRHIQATQYFKHLMQYEDQRFARHPRFRFFAFNSSMRWRALSEGNFYINKHSDIRNKTAADLKQLLINNPNAVKNIMFSGYKLRGTKAFWRMKSYELLDMVKQLGLPTLFLTLSAADYHWPDLFKLLVPDRDPESLTERERQKLIEVNPLVVDSFFLKRVKAFFGKVVQPMFKVQDFWYRIEYQHRGSPHIHGLLWLKNAPDISHLHEMSSGQIEAIADYFDQFVCCYHPAPSTPPADDHPCRRRLEVIEDTEKDLAELLNRVQLHSCNKAYCLRTNRKTGKMECRFKYPKEFKDKSVIELNEDGVFEYFGKRNVDNLNKFNKDLIQIWRANMDISPILSEKALVMYLAKYVSKFEPKSKGLDELLSSCAVNEQSAKSLVHKILIRSCSERDFSAQEVCHLLMGLPLVFCSRDFVIVSLNCVTDWIPMQRSVPDNNTEDVLTKGKSLVAKYAERTVHHNLSLWQVAKYYFLPSGRRRWHPTVLKILPKYRLTTDSHANLRYYRQQVLLHLPWHGEEKLLEGAEDWKTVYINNNLSSFEDADELSDMVRSAQDELQEDEPQGVTDTTAEEYMMISAMLPNGQATKTELGRREIDLNHDWTASAKKYEKYGSLHQLKLFITDKKKAELQTDLNTEMPQVMFNQEQEALMKLLETQIQSVKSRSSDSSTPKRVIVQGKAGTGKSLLIQAIKNRLQDEFGHDSYLLMAPTGIAALNIGGKTIHSALSLPLNLKVFKTLEGEKARVFCDKVAPIKFIIIDEYSMVGCHLLSVIDDRLKQGKGSNEDFGGLYVYIFGDIRQLPPVGDSALYQLPHKFDTMNSVRGKMLFSQFQAKVTLNHCHRQTDVKFINLLENLSVGGSTENDYETLQTRFISRLSSEEQDSFKDAIHLFPTLKEVAELNHKKLESLKFTCSGNPVPVARIPAKNNCTEAEAKEDGEGLSNVINLAEGCKVMLRSNLWTSQGLVNGAIGHVVDILYDPNNSSPDSAPEVIICVFPSYTGPCLDEHTKVVPIPAITRYWTTTDGAQCSRKQFPLSVSYACTIHKSQGLTLSKAVIDIGTRENACGITYVALSRVKTLSGLILKDFPKKRLTEKIKSNSMIVRNQREKEIFQAICNV